MWLINSALEWFFGAYDKALFAGVLLCWAAFAIATAVVVSTHRSVTGQMVGFILSIGGAVLILTYLDVASFNGAEKATKEVVKNLVIMTLGGLGSALLATAVMTPPNDDADLKQRAFIRNYVFVAFKHFFCFIGISTLLMLILAAFTGLIDHPVMTLGELCGLLASAILSFIGICAARASPRFVRWEGVSLLLLLAVGGLLLAIYLQALAGLWAFSNAWVLGLNGFVIAAHALHYWQQMLLNRYSEP